MMASRRSDPDEQKTLNARGGEVVKVTARNLARVVWRRPKIVTGGKVTRNTPIQKIPFLNMTYGKHTPYGDVIAPYDGIITPFLNMTSGNGDLFLKKSNLPPSLFLSSFFFRWRSPTASLPWREGGRGIISESSRCCTPLFISSC